MINDRHHPILLVFLVLAPGLNLSWQRWDAHLSARSQFLTCLSAECQKAPLIVESRIASSELGIISPSDNCVCKPQVPAFSQSHTGKVIKSASSPNQDTQCIDCLCHYISIQLLDFLGFLSEICWISQYPQPNALSNHRTVVWAQRTKSSRPRGPKAKASPKGCHRLPFNNIVFLGQPILFSSFLSKLSFSLKIEDEGIPGLMMSLREA